MNVFIEKVLNKFADNITDQIFLMIQNDPNLSTEYNNFKTHGEINQEIGKEIKRCFNLENNGHRSNPKSNLISGYTRHKIKE